MRVKIGLEPVRFCMTQVWTHPSTDWPKAYILALKEFLYYCYKICWQFPHEKRICLILFPVLGTSKSLLAAQVSVANLLPWTLVYTKLPVFQHISSTDHQWWKCTETEMPFTYELLASILLRETLPFEYLKIFTE